MVQTIQFLAGSDTNGTATPKVGGGAFIDTGAQFPGYSNFVLTTMAFVNRSGASGLIYLYNLTDSEQVGTAITVTSNGVPVKQTFAYTVGTAAGDLKSTAGGKLYEVRYAAVAPLATDLLTVQSVQLVVS